jgi:predicted nuclease of predicted toxin-antitoxin system
VRFFVDANLPPGLATWLAEQGHHAYHAKSLQMERTKDRAIWRYAKEHTLCIVTKDEDFVRLRTLSPTGRPSCG